MLLLRRTVAALRAAGHAVRLLAPSGPGGVLVGSGPSEVETLTAFDCPDVARWLGGDAAPELVRALRADAVLAFTDDLEIQAHLRPLASRLLARSPRPEPGRHASTWLAEAARPLDVDPGVAPPPLVFDSDERRAARSAAPTLSPGFLAVHPGSGARAKNWPPKRFAALARTHAAGRPWLLVVGPADEEAAAPLRGVPGCVPVHRLPLRVLGALLAQAGLFVGNDSGVSHLAAAAGAPTVALFGPTDPAVWGPVGPAVETARSPDGTMEGLGLDVVDAAARWLRKS